jgi:hypothetical protein
MTWGSVMMATTTMVAPQRQRSGSTSKMRLSSRVPPFVAPAGYGQSRLPAG